MEKAFSPIIGIGVFNDKKKEKQQDQNFSEFKTILSTVTATLTPDQEMEIQNILGTNGKYTGEKIANIIKYLKQQNLLGDITDENSLFRKILERYYPTLTIKQLLNFGEPSERAEKEDVIGEYLYKKALGKDTSLELTPEERE